MIFTEKISRTHLIAHVENRKIPIIFFICKNYSNARYIMFDKLFALVELSSVDTHTLLCIGDKTANFFPLFITLLTCQTDLPELSTLVII